jgi:hypothetical protein
MPVSPVSSLSSCPPSYQPGSHDLPEFPATSNPLILTWPLESDLEDLSTCLYFYTYVCNPRLSHNRDDFYFLPKMFATASPASCLQQAVKLVSLAAFANRWNPASFERQIRAGYARAIQATNASLRDPVQYLRDDTLMSVWLLGSFEVGLSTLWLCVSCPHLTWRTGHFRIFHVVALTGQGLAVAHCRDANAGENERSRAVVDDSWYQALQDSPCSNREQVRESQVDLPY